MNPYIYKLALFLGPCMADVGLCLDILIDGTSC